MHGKHKEQKLCKFSVHLLVLVSYIIMLAKQLC